MADRQNIVNLLEQTLSANSDVVRGATELLDRLSPSTDFSFSLLTIVAGLENFGVRIAAATYLKNLLRRSLLEETQSESVGKEFKDQLVRALLHVEPPVLRVLVEAFRVIVDVEFVKKNAWSEIVPSLKYSIQHSNYVSGHGNSELKTLNTLAVLQGLVRPYQYFLNPKVVKEPVPAQLEIIANEILVPLLAVFHCLVEKELAHKGTEDFEIEKIILIICKCMYYTLRSYMPSALVPLLPSFCRDLCSILDSLSLEIMSSSDSWQGVRQKMGKRCLLIFCNLITRHRRHSDKLMLEIVKRVLGIVSYCKDIDKLDSLSERVVSLAFDVISRILQTGSGWRVVSPHFSTLLETSILPALLLHEKDIMEWEEDADEFVRKNFPSDLEEISGWRDDLFTVRKSAINLLGVISMSKGIPQGGAVSSSKRKKGEKNKGGNRRSSMGELLVLPFLSKFPVPTCDTNTSDRAVYNYFGVLMGYGGLQDFLREQKPGYTTALIQNRVLPLYKASGVHPCLIASANWVLGELAPCLPEDMSLDVYSALLKAMTMPDCDNISCSPVRATSAGAISTLLENDYLPPDWLSLLQVIISRIVEDEEASMLYELLSYVVENGESHVALLIPSIMPPLIQALSKCIPSEDEQWPQVVERGFAALAVMAKAWENAEPEEAEEEQISRDWAPGRITIARAFSVLLQKAWLTSKQTVDGATCTPRSCIDDASTLLCFMIRSVTSSGTVLELNLSNLLLVWAGFIAHWHAWEEQEDLAVFECIKEVVDLRKRYDLEYFFKQIIPWPAGEAPHVPKLSVIEGISAFVAEAISQYPSAMRRSCSCIHMLLHGLPYPVDMEDVKQSLVICFSQAVVHQLRESRTKLPLSRKPLLLAAASCYLCHPDIVERILEKDEQGGFVVWASSFDSVICSISETSTGSANSEIKLVVITLAKVIERLLQQGNPFNDLSQRSFNSLLEAFIRMKVIQQDGAEEDEEEDGDDDDDEEEEEEETDEDEDSEEEFLEETEEEFLERYAKAAAELENESFVEEGDIEDGDEELELDFLDEIDAQKTLSCILQSYHQVLVQGQGLSPQLISGFLQHFPDFGPFFHQVK